MFVYDRILTDDHSVKVHSSIQFLDGYFLISFLTVCNGKRRRDENFDRLLVPVSTFYSDDVVTNRSDFRHVLDLGPVHKERCIRYINQRAVLILVISVSAIGMLNRELSARNVSVCSSVFNSMIANLIEQFAIGILYTIDIQLDFRIGKIEIPQTLGICGHVHRDGKRTNLLIVGAAYLKRVVSDFGDQGSRHIRFVIQIPLAY